MKRILFILFGWGALAATAAAQSFNLGPCAVSAGGGASSGGGFRLIGDAGRPHPGPLTGGGYALTVGFWSAAGEPPLPVAPRLSIQRAAATMVTISWPGSDTGWKLQAATSLAAPSADWIDVELPCETNADGCHITLPLTASTCYYRLRQQ